MISISKKQNIIINTVAAVVFAVLMCLNIFFAYSDFKDMFMSNNFVETVVMPVKTIVLSSLFFVLLVGLSVGGMILKNKCLIGISLGYSVLLFMGIVLFVLFVLEVFNVELLNTIAMWYSVASMAPMLGFIWFFGIFAIILFIIHFIALIVFSVKVFKVKK